MSEMTHSSCAGDPLPVAYRSDAAECAAIETYPIPVPTVTTYYRMWASAGTDTPCPDDAPVYCETRPAWAWDFERK